MTKIDGVLIGDIGVIVFITGAIGLIIAIGIKKPEWEMISIVVFWYLFVGLLLMWSEPEGESDTLKRSVEMGGVEQ